MDRYQQETEQLFLKLYDEHASAIYRHCYFRVSSRELAEDLTQESFMRTWNYMREGKTIDNPKAFVYRIAEHLVIDYYRKKKEMSLEVLAEHGFDPAGEGADGILDHAALREIRDVMGRLEPAHREILVMRYIDDLPIRTIAEIVGESENVVSVRIHRATQRLKKLLTHGKPN